MIDTLIDLLFGGCRHTHISLPLCGWQKCMDCAARRRYRSFGARPGPWMKEPELAKVNGKVYGLEVINEN